MPLGRKGCCAQGEGLDIDFIPFLYRFECDKLDTIISTKAEDARACICRAKHHLSYAKLSVTCMHMQS